MIESLIISVASLTLGIGFFSLAKEALPLKEWSSEIVLVMMGLVSSTVGIMGIIIALGGV